MKVILIDDLKGTGKKGEVVEVKDGYGRNFLIPKGLALPNAEGNVTRLEHVVKGLANKRAREMKTAEEMKARLEEISLHIKKRVGLDGRLFGSVTHKEIAEELAGWHRIASNIYLWDYVDCYDGHMAEDGLCASSTRAAV